MANLTAGYVFGSSEVVTNTKLGTLVSSGSVSNIVDADVASGAAIAYSKLSLTGHIADADVSSMAAISYSKLSLSASVKNADLAVGVGTSANNILALDGSAKIPAVDGSQLTGITQGNLFSILDYGTSASASTSRAQTSLKIAWGTIAIVTGGSTVSLSNLPFTSSSSWVIQVTETGGSGSDENRGTIGGTPTSGSAATIYNTDNANHACSWFAIGV